MDLLTGHFIFACYTSLFTIIPLYVVYRGGEEWQIGVLVGSFGVASLLVRPFAGRWIHRVGAKHVALAGAAVLGVGSLLHIPAAGVWWLVPVRIFQGVGLAIGPVATSTIVANLAPAPRRAEALAYMGNAISVAGLYSPVAGYFLLTRFGFPTAFGYSAACAFMGCLTAVFISLARTAVPGKEDSPKSVPLVSKSALFPTAVFLSYTFTTGPVATFLPVLAEDRGLGNPGLYFTINSLTTMATMLASGPISDRMGRAAVITPGLLVTAVAMLVLTFAHSQPVFLAAGFLGGLGFGLLQPGIQSLTVDRAKARERGAALATLQSAWDIGGAGGAFIVGPIATAVGVASTFGIVAVGTIFGAAGFLIGNARRPAHVPGREAAAGEPEARRR
jgi:MFS family permease